MATRFDNPTFEDYFDDEDQTFTDNPEVPLQLQAAGGELPVVPNESADTLRNDHARRNLNVFFR